MAKVIVYLLFRPAEISSQACYPFPGLLFEHNVSFYF